MGIDVAAKADQRLPTGERSLRNTHFLKGWSLRVNPVVKKDPPPDQQTGAAERRGHGIAAPARCRLADCTTRLYKVVFKTSFYALLCASVGFVLHKGAGIPMRRTT